MIDYLPLMVEQQLNNYQQLNNLHNDWLAGRLDPHHEFHLVTCHEISGVYDSTIIYASPKNKFTDEHQHLFFS